MLPRALSPPANAVVVALASPAATVAAAAAAATATAVRFAAACVLAFAGSVVAPQLQRSQPLRSI